MSASSSVYQHALEIWKEADLPGLQQNLDEAIVEVKELETKTLESRKILAQGTKKFKKLGDDAKLAQLNKIIKHYQVEIDSLTSRCKFSEQKLFEVYGKLSEAPDPRPLLKSSMGNLENSGSVEELRIENGALKDRLAKVADYDKLKARLLELEQNSAKTLTKRLIAKEQEVNSTWDEKARNWNDKENELLKTIENLKNNNKVLESKLSKQFDLGETSDTTNENGDTQKKNNSNHPPSSAEFQLLAQELESAQLRVLDLEKRNEELSGQLTKATNSAEQDSELHVKDLKINRLESENALLSASLERERSSLIEDNRSKLNQIEAMSQELASYKSELTTIRRKLANYSDYEEIKQELSTLKRIEFGAADTDSHDENVESSLISANKRLQSNLADLRGKSQDLEKDRTSLQNQVIELQQKLQKLEELNSKLESDLGKVEDISSQFSDTASMMSGVTRQMTNRLGNVGRWSPTSSIVGIPEETEPVGLTSTGNSILPIVTQQRDRIRNKNMELERQLKQNSLDHGKLKSEILKLKQDNQKLYERIRYLSSYSRNGTSGVKPPIDSSILDVESQYSGSYEESLHPLADFKKRELERYHRNKMSPLEKLFLSFANIVLANKASRMAFMFYCIGLHVLVIVVFIYVSSSNEKTSPVISGLGANVYGST